MQRILVAVDSSDEANRAARFAARLVSPQGVLELLYVYDASTAAQLGMRALSKDKLALHGEEVARGSIDGAPRAVEGACKLVHHVAYGHPADEIVGARAGDERGHHRARLARAGAGEGHAARQREPEGPLALRPPHHGRSLSAACVPRSLRVSRRTTLGAGVAAEMRATSAHHEGGGAPLSVAAPTLLEEEGPMMMESSRSKRRRVVAAGLGACSRAGVAPASRPRPRSPPRSPAQPAQTACAKQWVHMPMLMSSRPGDRGRHQNREILREIVRTAQSRKEIRRVRVEGHTDTCGNELNNMALSETRAASPTSSSRWACLGTCSDTIGYGSTQPRRRVGGHQQGSASSPTGGWSSACSSVAETFGNAPRPRGRCRVGHPPVLLSRSSSEIPCLAPGCG